MRNCCVSAGQLGSNRSSVAALIVLQKESQIHEKALAGFFLPCKGAWRYLRSILALVNVGSLFNAC